jgi:hypothetical protein
MRMPVPSHSPSGTRSQNYDDTPTHGSAVNFLLDLDCWSDEMPSGTRSQNYDETPTRGSAAHFFLYLDCWSDETPS